MIQIRQQVQSLFTTKFSRDVVWNLGSTVLLGISGILLNIVIGRYYGAEVLGVFSQVFALYAILSQFAAGGLYFSVLKFVSEFAQNRELCSKIISAALALTAILALIVCFLSFILRTQIANLLESPDVAVGLLVVLPGVWFFAMNKVMLFAVNGLREMRAFAIFQSLRYVFIISFVLVGAILSVQGVYLPLAFTGSEAILFVCLLVYLFREYPFSWAALGSEWIKTHLIFGLKAFPSGLLLDVNLRVDILMVGYFMSDSLVGIYSLAAMLAQGFLQLPVAVLVNMNPKLTQLITTKQFEQLSVIVKRTKQIVYLMMFIVVVIGIGLFPFLVNILVDNEQFQVAWPIFIILVLGIFIGSGYAPFRWILNQAGYPGFFTLFITALVITNIVLNAIFIPIWGLYGAAIATSTALIASIFYLKFAAWSTMRIRI